MKRIAVNRPHDAAGTSRSLGNSVVKAVKAAKQLWRRLEQRHPGLALLSKWIGRGMAVLLSLTVSAYIAWMFSAVKPCTNEEMEHKAIVARIYYEAANSPDVWHTFRYSALLARRGSDQDSRDCAKACANGFLVAVKKRQLTIPEDCLTSAKEIACTGQF